jgi:hypothetical protein
MICPSAALAPSQTVNVRRVRPRPSGAALQLTLLIALATFLRQALDEQATDLTALGEIDVRPPARAVNSVCFYRPAAGRNRADT